MLQKFSNFKGANYLELILKFVLWMALHSILVVAVGDKKWKSFFCASLVFAILTWWDQTRKSVLSSPYDIIVITVRFPYLPICWWKWVTFLKSGGGPCLPDEIMTLWLLRMWIADDMETIVKWQTTVTREMGDVGQTWKWGPRAKSYYVVSLYWDPHTYMWTSNQNLNRTYFCCPCKICLKRRCSLDRLSFYIEPTATYTQYVWDIGQPPKIVLALAMF